MMRSGTSPERRANLDQIWLEACLHFDATCYDEILKIKLFFLGAVNLVPLNLIIGFHQFQRSHRQTLIWYKIKPELLPEALHLLLFFRFYFPVCLPLSFSHVLAAVLSQWKFITLWNIFLFTDAFRRLSGRHRQITLTRAVCKHSSVVHSSIGQKPNKWDLVSFQRGVIFVSSLRFTC